MSAWEGSSWQEAKEAKEARERGQLAITSTPSEAIVVRPRTLATVAADLEAEMRAAKAGKAAEARIPGLRAELEAMLNGTETP